LDHTRVAHVNFCLTRFDNGFDDRRLCMATDSLLYRQLRAKI